MENICLIGLGLIGASLSLGIKKAHPTCHISGWDANAASCQIALEKGIIDEVAENLAEAETSADVIILAVPVKSSLLYLQQLATLPLKKNVLITDVGSTKQEVVAEATRLNLPFIGGHPMAGSHKSGVQAADVDLFENAYYIFTPTENEKKRVDLLQQLFAGSKAKYVVLTAAEHDEITGMLSHLPHIIAAGLVNQAGTFNLEHPRAKQLAAGGFRDITRIASSDPVMWTDILMSNREILLHQLAQWQNEMTEVATMIATGDQKAIYQFFDQAKATRDTMPIHQKGAIPAFYDLFVDVPDEPGVIAKVTSLLAEAAISIINLKIQETREDIIGVLQISFKNAKDLAHAQAVIEAQTSYHCRTK